MTDYNWAKEFEYETDRHRGYDEFVCDCCHNTRQGEEMQRVEDMRVCETCAAKRFWSCQHCSLLWPNKIKPAITNRGFTCEDCLHLDHSSE